MRVEVNFDGSSGGATSATDFVERALKALQRVALETGVALSEVKITAGQATETAANARRMQDSISGVGREARQATRDLEKMRIATYGSSGLFGGILPGGGRARTGAYGLLGILGLAGAGPVGAAGVGGLAALAPLAATGGAALGVLAGAFTGLSDAIGGNVDKFNALDKQSQQFVQTIRSLIPWVEQLQSTARAGLFPAVEAGLHSALTPENAAAIEDAVRGIASALGDVATQWGKSLGSPAFTQGFAAVMGAAPQELMDAGDAALHLAAALGKITVAAVPLTEWLTRTVDEGARLVDQWVASAQASGDLARGLDGAKQELEIVARFALALVEAVGQLVVALAPLGNEILVVLTGALQNLADWVDKNRQGIRDFAEGALQALLNIVETLGPPLLALAGYLVDIVNAMGGWETAFTIILTGALALKVAEVVSGIYLMVTAEEAATAQAVLLRGALLALGSRAVLGVLGGVGVAVGALAFPDSVASDVTGSGGYNKGTSLESAYQKGQQLAQQGKWTQIDKLREQTNVSVPLPLRELGVGGGMDPATLAAFNKGVAAGSGGSVQPPTSFMPTHQTEGLPGFPALDIMVDAGTKVLAPEDGTLTRTSGSAPKSGSNNINGYSLYFVGQASGNVYFMTHLSNVAPEGNYKKGDVIGIVASGTQGGPHVHVGLHQGGTSVAYAPSTSSPPGIGAPTSTATATPRTTASALTSPFGTPPPFQPSKIKPVVTPWGLPIDIQTAIARAGTTRNTLADDVKATGDALRWVKSQIGDLKGQDLVTALDALRALQDQMHGFQQALRPAGYTGQPRAGGALAAIIRRTVGAAATTLTPFNVTDLSGTGGGISLSQINQAVTTINDQTKRAIAQHQADFSNAFRTMAAKALAAFDDEVAKHKTPAETLLEQLQSAHNDQQFQRQLDAAEKDLADALTPRIDSDQVMQSIKAIIGRYSLANTIDEVQSAILGGTSVGVDSRDLIQQLKDAMNVAATPDPDRVKAAQQEVEDAKYAITVSGLEKTAAAERDAYNDQVARQRTALEALAGNWQQFFDKLGGNIAGIPAAWAAMLTAIGAPEAAAAVTAAAPSIAQVSANPAVVAAASAAKSAAAKAAGALAGLFGGSVHASGGIATRAQMGVFGEAGPEALIPLSDPRARQMLGGDVTVNLHGNIPADWIQVEIDRNAARLSRRLGERTDRRIREGAI